MIRTDYEIDTPSILFSYLFVFLLDFFLSAWKNAECKIGFAVIALYDLCKRTLQIYMTSFDPEEKKNDEIIHFPPFLNVHFAWERPDKTNCK